MIQRMQRELVAILTIITSFFLIMILVCINYTNYRANIAQTQQLLRHDIRLLGVEPFCQAPQIDDPLYASEYATVRQAGDGSFTVLVNQMQEISNDQLLTQAKAEAQVNRSIEKGLSPFSTVVCIKFFQKDCNLYIFSRNSYTEVSSQKLLSISILLGVGGVIVLFFLSCLLSRRMVRPAAEAFANQRDFISDASHELKTPLTIISSNADFLEAQIGNCTQLQFIHFEIERMSSLINQMLTLAKMETPSATIQKEHFCLSDAWLEIILPFEAVAFEQSITLDTQIDTEFNCVGNRERLQQLMSILIDNALSHTPSGGTITIHAARKKKKILMSVTNTGDPIPKELQARIFDRFYRADPSHNQDGNRHGLGLAIARSITELHGGSITVTSTNHKTTFTVTLP